MPLTTVKHRRAIFKLNLKSKKEREKKIKSGNARMHLGKYVYMYLYVFFLRFGKVPEIKRNKTNEKKKDENRLAK